MSSWATLDPAALAQRLREQGALVAGEWHEAPAILALLKFDPALGPMWASRGRVVLRHVKEMLEEQKGAVPLPVLKLVVKVLAEVLGNEAVSQQMLRSALWCAHGLLYRSVLSPLARDELGRSLLAFLMNLTLKLAKDQRTAHYTTRISGIRFAEKIAMAFLPLSAYMQRIKTELHLELLDSPNGPFSGLRDLQLPEDASNALLMCAKSVVVDGLIAVVKDGGDYRVVVSALASSARVASTRPDVLPEVLRNLGEVVPLLRGSASARDLASIYYMLMRNVVVDRETAENTDILKHLTDLGFSFLVERHWLMLKRRDRKRQQQQQDMKRLHAFSSAPAAPQLLPSSSALDDDAPGGTPPEEKKPLVLVAGAGDLAPPPPPTQHPAPQAVPQQHAVPMVDEAFILRQAQAILTAVFTEPVTALPDPPKYRVRWV